MNYVLVTVSGGIISEVYFYVGISRAIQSLAEFVKAMNPEKDDAGVYGPEGMIANAKNFLDENDQYVDNVKEIIVQMVKHDKPIQ
jgi:hypothetical protein